VLACSVVGSSGVVATGFASSARPSNGRCGFGVARSAHVPFCSGSGVSVRACLQAARFGARSASLARAERPRERGQAQLGAECAAHENEGMSQCLGASSAAGTRVGASRSHQKYKAVPRALPNPSIERTPYGMLRMPPVAAHVERWASQNPLCTRPCTEYGNAVVLGHAHGCGNNGLCSVRRRSLV
jgi:hypothetical protein